MIAVPNYLVIISKLSIPQKIKYWLAYWSYRLIGLPVNKRRWENCKSDQVVAPCTVPDIPTSSIHLSACEFVCEVGLHEVSLSLLLSSTAFTILSFLWPMSMLDLRIIQFYHYLGHHITHRLPLSLSMCLIRHMHTHTEHGTASSPSTLAFCVCTSAWAKHTYIHNHCC
jgi:hypothetical protein